MPNLAKGYLNRKNNTNYLEIQRLLYHQKSLEAQEEDLMQQLILLDDVRKKLVAVGEKIEQLREEDRQKKKKTLNTESGLYELPVLLDWIKLSRDSFKKKK